MDLGEKCIVYDDRESVKVNSSDLIILQDESYLNRKPDYKSQAPIVLIASLKYFHYWVSMGGGYLTPKDKLCSFKQAVKAVLDENDFISGEVTRFLRLDNKERQEILLQKELEASLTTSEIEVLLKTAKGSSAAKIANNRRCSVSTVYTHNKNIRKKIKIEV